MQVTFDTNLFKLLAIVSSLQCKLVSMRIHLILITLRCLQKKNNEISLVMRLLYEIEIPYHYVWFTPFEKYI